MTTELSFLFERINNFDSYPAGVRRICGDEPGNLFFPGGSGILNTERGMISSKKFMIAGYQFDTRLNYLKAHGLKKNRLKTSTAWANLLLLLVKGGIDPEHCFFTNAMLGALYEGEESNRSSAFARKVFREYCRSLFRMELEIQKPQVIVVLGLKAARSLSTLHPKLEGWKTLENYTIADQDNLIENVPLTGSFASTFVLLTHPAGRRVNYISNEFDNFSLDNKRIRMLSKLKTGQ
jgi:uracil-DNA glycosylase